MRAYPRSALAMSDLAVVANSVLPDSDAGTEQGTAGVAIMAGQTVFKDSDGTYKLTDASKIPPKTRVRGIALNTAQPGQPLVVQKTGGLDPGVAMAVGSMYISSGNNPGGIAPISDFANGWITAPLGVAVGSRRLQLTIANPFDAPGVGVESFDFSNKDNAVYLAIL